MERPTRETTLELIASKDNMEDELKALMEVLQSVTKSFFLETALAYYKLCLIFFFQNNTDLTDPLVDQEGFPRSDIDVYQVRMTRHKIICIIYISILH